MNAIALPYGSKAPHQNKPLSMTPVMSEQSERQLDVTLEACKRQLLWAYAQYEGAMKTDEKYVATYWDGYIRGIQHVIEMDGQ